LLVEVERRFERRSLKLKAVDQFKRVTDGKPAMSVDLAFQDRGLRIGRPAPQSASMT